MAKTRRTWVMIADAARDYVDEVERLTQIASSFVPAWLPSAAPRPATPRSRPID